MPSNDTSPSAVRSILRGARLRCPRCGEGRIYRGYTDLDACSSCGHRFLPSSGEFTGALMAAQGLFGLITAIGFVVLYVNGVRSWWLLAWLAFGAAVLPALLYRNVKGAWIGLLGLTSAKRP